jgi:hypothetical protein
MIRLESFSRIASRKRPQIELCDDIDNKPGQVLFRQSILNGRREKELLISIGWDEFISHSVLAL